MQKSLPCPGCGYDLQATPSKAGLCRCPECGSAWTVQQLFDHAQQPYLTTRRLIGWALGMPVLYAFLNVFTCFTCLNIFIESSLSEKASWAFIATYLGLTALLVGLCNRDMAGRWASRMYQNPIKGGQRAGGWYWGMLLGLTAFQMACIYLYPVLPLITCFQLIDGWWW
ncbi:MAG: hypothetical protein AAGJ38_11220 [Planctomycetota bacterium]